MTPQETKLEACLDRALIRAGGTHDFREDVVPMLLDGRAQWWQHGQGAAVTEIKTYPRLRELNVWLVAGALDDCLTLLGDIEEFAHKNECDRVVGLGRYGWLRVLKKNGFRLAGVQMERRL